MIAIYLLALLYSQWEDLECAEEDVESTKN